MYPRIQLPPTVRRLIDAQAGVISVHQAMGCGTSRETFRRHAKDWHHVTRGIYVTDDLTWDAAAWVGLLRGGDGAVIGGAAACYLDGLITSSPEQLSVWVPTRRDPVPIAPYAVRFRRGDRRGRGLLTRTLVEHSLLDLAAEADPHTLIEASTRAFTNKRTTPSRLLGTMTTRTRQPQRKLIEELCDPSNQSIQSVLEWLFEKFVIQPHHFGGLKRQVRFTRSSRVDIFFEGHSLIVELDGRSFHDADRDAMRDNAHALQFGLTTLRFTWTMVLHEPCLVAATIAQALRVRGWQDGLRRCPGCVPEL